MEAAAPSELRGSDAFGGLAVTVAVNIDSVETGDSSPSAAPFRISDKTGKDVLDFAFTVTADDIIRAWRVRFDPMNRNIGQLLASRGMVCGTGDRCGSPVARSLAVTSPLEVAEEIEEAEIGANPDGEYPVEVYAMIAGEWN